MLASYITLTEMHPSQHMAPFYILQCRQHTKPCSDVTNYHHRHQMSGQKNWLGGEIKESEVGGGARDEWAKKQSLCRSDGRRQCQAGSLITRGRDGGQPGEQPTWQKEKEKTEACWTRKSCLVKRQEISCVQRYYAKQGSKGQEIRRRN